LDDKPSLTTGAENPLLPQLLKAINEADQVEIAVAFVKNTGLNLIFDALIDAIERGATVSILTSDYLSVTDPASLRSLMLLSERSASVKVFETGNASFHLKVYIFSQDSTNSTAAFIGSSNVSRAALKSGIEWNYRVYGDEKSSNNVRSDIELIRNEYRDLFQHQRSLVLSHDWIDDYELRYKLAAPAAVPGATEVELKPIATLVQEEALLALRKTREEGYKRGVVVLATGLGKTFLAAFDCLQNNANRVLFLAHREEILIQAERAFLRVWPKAKTGYYTGVDQDLSRAKQLNVVCASIQTLSGEKHLNEFDPKHFDYIVVDEFHHATAPTYRRVISYFDPDFLLGLTATPDRSDQSDILSLCDDNLVYSFGLFKAVSDEFLVPFSYHGIFDEHVNYEEIPWRNSKFDPRVLSSKLATLARARHVHTIWREKAQTRTLAFCVSRSHSDFMAEKFLEWGVRAASVHGASELKRSESLDLLRSGSLEVIFSVDLFSEGVDLPAIDTVLMLRPTDSKIMFLQQLGRGLRKSDDKDRLVVLDFIGNHQGFFNKSQALFGVSSNHKALSEFARSYENKSLNLPAGCFVNYDLEIIEFLKTLSLSSILDDYVSLRDSLNRRPTFSEFYRSGASVQKMRLGYGGWWGLVSASGDLVSVEQSVLEVTEPFFREVETTSMNKCFKMITLDAMLELEGFSQPSRLKDIAETSKKILSRRPDLLSDIKATLHPLSECSSADWYRYWRQNPIEAWNGSYFKIDNEVFVPRFEVTSEISSFESMLQELVDYRISQYKVRHQDNVVRMPTSSSDRVELPFFPNIRIACGTFKPGKADYEEFKNISSRFGTVHPDRNFLARASGNSMNGGKHPVLDGDLLLLEHISPSSAGSVSNQIVVVERLDETGEGEYLLREVRKNKEGQHVLFASNPAYEPMLAQEDFRSLARFVSVVEPIDLAIGNVFIREDIPELFGEVFNTGNWQSGHVVLKEKQKHVLLVTLNKQGKQADYRYIDYFEGEDRFHWQSQNSATESTSRGKAIINHLKDGIELHLFVRESKLGANKKAAPFTYYGKLEYLSHTGSKPMSVLFKLLDV